MKSNVFVLLISLTSLQLLLGNSASVDNIVVEYHAFTESTKIETESSNNISSPTGTRDTGHAYFVFKNLSSSSVYVGYYLLSPNQTVSVGLWHNGGSGSSSSSSSNNSSSGGSSSSQQANFFNQGVLYNYESCIYNVSEFTSNERYLRKTISLSKLSQMSIVIKNKNSDYNVMTYNCATFATELWNIADDKTYWTGWFRTPYNIWHEIGVDYSPYYEGSGYLSTSSTYIYYTNATLYRTYYI